MPKADYPNIRLFTVPKRVALDPQPDTLPASWQICTPDSAKDFSAVAYFFARDLHRKLKVPIGIVESAWPGTTIEEWMAPEAAQRDPQVKSALDSWNGSEGRAFVPAFDLEFDDFELLADPATGNKNLPFSSFDEGSASEYAGWILVLRLALGSGNHFRTGRSRPRRQRIRRSSHGPPRRF